MQKCTFQPCLDKTQYSRYGFKYNQKDSTTSTSYADYDIDNGTHVSSLKKRCRSQPRNQTMPNFAIVSTLSGNTGRSRQQFYADMTQYKERREQKVNRMRHIMDKEQTLKAKVDFDTVSMKSKRSFSMVSKKSFKEI